MCHLPHSPPTAPYTYTREHTLISEGCQQLLLPPGKYVIWAVRGTGFAGEKEEENEFLLPKARIRTALKTSFNQISAEPQRLVCQ